MIAIADWAVGNRMSLGVFYVLPMMLGARGTHAGPEIILLATACSSLRSKFDLPSPYVEMVFRFVFALIAYSACGLVVAALIRNRRVAMEHLEKNGHGTDSRREAEEQLKTLAESSPAAILTVDGDGIVIAANNSASRNVCARRQRIAEREVDCRISSGACDALQVG